MQRQRLDFARIYGHMQTMNKPVATPDSMSTTPLAAEVDRRRTFAIISHPDAGKTTPVSYTHLTLPTIYSV